VRQIDGELTACVGKFRDFQQKQTETKESYNIQGYHANVKMKVRSSMGRGTTSVKKLFLWFPKLINCNTKRKVYKPFSWLA
jgi:hypothetical protein